MNLPNIADRMGLSWPDLNHDQQDRLLIIETLKPDTPRADKVRFVRIGDDGNFERNEMQGNTERQAEAYRDLKSRRAKLQLGFASAATTRAHEQLFAQIAAALPEVGAHSRPLSDPAITANHLKRVRELAEQLPGTREVLTFLTETADGVVTHLV